MPGRLSADHSHLGKWILPPVWLTLWGYFTWLMFTDPAAITWEGALQPPREVGVSRRGSARRVVDGALSLAPPAGRSAGRVSHRRSLAPRAPRPAQRGPRSAVAVQAKPGSGGARRGRAQVGWFPRPNPLRAQVGGHRRGIARSGHQGDRATPGGLASTSGRWSRPPRLSGKSPRRAVTSAAPPSALRSRRRPRSAPTPCP